MLPLPDEKQFPWYGSRSTEIKTAEYIFKHNTYKPFILIKNVNEKKTLTLNSGRHINFLNEIFNLKNNKQT